MVELWDLVERDHEAILSCTVSTMAITALSYSPADEVLSPATKAARHRQYLAVGVGPCRSCSGHNAVTKAPKTLFVLQTHALKQCTYLILAGCSAAL